MRRTKSTLLLTALVAGVFMVLATNSMGQNDTNNLEFQEKFNTFLEDTVTMRQDLASKQTEVQDEMLSTEPDRNKIALLTEEIYQLRQALETKAKEDGVDIGLNRGGGCGCGGGGPRGFKS